MARFSGLRFGRLPKFGNPSFLVGPRGVRVGSGAPTVCPRAVPGRRGARASAGWGGRALAVSRGTGIAPARGISGAVAGAADCEIQLARAYDAWTSRGRRTRACAGDPVPGQCGCPTHPVAAGGDVARRTGKGLRGGRRATGPVGAPATGGGRDRTRRPATSQAGGAGGRRVDSRANVRTVDALGYSRSRGLRTGLSSCLRRG